MGNGCGGTIREHSVLHNWVNVCQLAPKAKGKIVLSNTRAYFRTENDVKIRLITFLNLSQILLKKLKYLLPLNAKRITAMVFVMEVVY